MRWRKIVAAGLGIILAAGLMAAGCGEKNEGTQSSKKGKQEQAVGRYLEEDMKPPVQEGEIPMGAYKKEGILYLYTMSGNQESGVQYYVYENQDGKWSDAREEAGLKAMSAEIIADHVFYGQDKNLYAMGTPASAESIAFGGHILKVSPEGTWEDITPENLLKADEDGFAASIIDLDVLSDGKLCISNGSSKQAEVYQDGEKVFSADTEPMMSNFQNTICASQKSLAVTENDSKGVDIYSTEDFSKTGSVELGKKDESYHLAGGEDGTWFCLTRKGIFRFQDTGAIVETLMDGSYGKMSADQVEAVSFFCGEEDDFYALYRDFGTEKLYMAHYTYEKDMPAAADKTLTVYGLKENKTVEQAISLFQSQNPDVKVDYTYAVGETEKPSTDHIRNLNTELLGGNGPDVLLLDGLPVDSYIDKGVLGDLTEFESRLVKDGTLLKNIGNALEEDGKIYGIPARIGLPVVGSKGEKDGALESIDTLAAYLEANPKDQIFGDSIHGRIGTALLSLMYQDLVKEDGSVNEEQLVQLLEAWQKICTNMDTASMEEELGIGADEEEEQNDYFTTSYFDDFDGGKVSVTELKGYGSMAYPCHVMKEAAVEPKTADGRYVPYVIAGVNASSKQQDLGEAFIKALFTNEVQGSQTWDGFPVTDSALKEMIASADSAANQKEEFSSSYKNPKTGEESMITYGNPDGQMTETYVGLIHSADKPFLPNHTLFDTIKEEMEKCYEGTETPEEASKAIVQKMDTYLAE